MFNSSSRDLPKGVRRQRAYVVGDVHGRLDLLDELLARIHADLDQRPSRKTMLVFVGDLIDRGPNSAQVVERLRTYRHPGVRTAFILGNHEEVLLRILAGEAELIDDWRRFGGAQCLESYGVDVGELIGRDDDAQLEIVREAIPKAHAEFLGSFVDTCRFGDYLFVHAGIRPGVPLDDQSTRDLRWIREDFLTSTVPHPYMVVHGHTITPEPDEQNNRIGIDTGAYASGVLTAICIEGTSRRYLRATL